MSAERRSRTVTAYRYAFTLSRSSSVATRIGSTILSFGRPAFALTAIKVGRSSLRDVFVLVGAGNSSWKPGSGTSNSRPARSRRLTSEAKGLQASAGVEQELLEFTN